MKKYTINSFLFVIGFFVSLPSAFACISDKKIADISLINVFTVIFLLASLTTFFVVFCLNLIKKATPSWSLFPQRALTFLTLSLLFSLVFLIFIAPEFELIHTQLGEIPENTKLLIKYRYFLLLPTAFFALFSKQYFLSAKNKLYYLAILFHIESILLLFILWLLYSPIFALGCIT